MKSRRLLLGMMVLAAGVAFTGCRASKGGSKPHCPAYGQVEMNQGSDFAKTNCVVEENI